MSQLMVGVAGSLVVFGILALLPFARDAVREAVLNALIHCKDSNIVAISPLKGCSRKNARKFIY